MNNFIYFVCNNSVNKFRLLLNLNNNLKQKMNEYVNFINIIPAKVQCGFTPTQHLGFEAAA